MRKGLFYVLQVNVYACKERKKRHARVICLFGWKERKRAGVGKGGQGEGGGSMCVCLCSLIVNMGKEM